ncbi:MAG: 5'/3'-nucleotidase SurE, partial [Polyangiales bacterium]
MISNHRLPLVLLLAFGFAISSLIACSSDSDQPPAGPLRILITNDDGVGAPGIDAVVEALKDDHEIIVSAPAGNASGAGDWTVDDPRTDLGRPDCTNGTGEATPASTASGYDEDTWAVDG